MSLPPGPRSMLLTTLAYLRDPYGSALRTHARHGATCSVPTPFGAMVVTRDPEGAREILAADPDTYGAMGVELLGPILGTSSIILMGEPRHRATRKLLAPPFHGARMRAYGDTMQAISQDELGRWPVGTPFALQSRTQAISLRVIVETIFGVTAAAASAQLQAELVALVEALDPSFMLLERLRSPLWWPWRRFQRRTAVVETLVHREIAARRERPGEDILSLLLAARYEDGRPLEDREVLEQLMTLLVAGHETTAIALAWACHLVCTHPDVQARLLAELDALGPAPAADEVARQPYLEAVCLETLRLQPLVPTIARRLVRPLRLRGVEVPSGLAVGISVIGLHRDPSLYPDPEVFRPERFLGEGFAPHEYLPFGGGSRRCLGAAFATHEMKIVLATILASQTLTSAEPGRVGVRVRNTVVGPRGGVRVVARPRA